MKNAIIVALLCTGLLVVSGCMNVISEIEVKPDGSGNITEEVMMTANAMGMMQGMGMKEFPIEEDKYKAKAKKMGEGVTYVSSEKISRNGGQGVKVVYAFTDINKVKYDMNPDAPGSDKKAQGDPMEFKFTAGEPATLEIMMPAPDEKKVAEAQSHSEDGKADMPSDAEFAQMSQMFQGFRVWVRLRIDGKITETNAQYVNKSKNGISLMDLNIGKLLAKKQNMSKLMALKEIKDVNTAKAALKDIPELRVEDAEKVTVKFE